MCAKIIIFTSSFELEIFLKLYRELKKYYLLLNAEIEVDRLSWENAFLISESVFLVTNFPLKFVVTTEPLFRDTCLLIINL